MIIIILRVRIQFITRKVLNYARRRDIFKKKLCNRILKVWDSIYVQKNIFYASRLIRGDRSCEKFRCSENSTNIYVHIHIHIVYLVHIRSSKLINYSYANICHVGFVVLFYRVFELT